MADERGDLDNFIGKVDEIEGLIKDLITAQGNGEHQGAINNADKYLDAFNKGQQEAEEKTKKKKYASRDNTGVNRTVINDSSLKNEASPFSGPELPSGISQEGFMAVLEKDAKERATRKASQRKEADVVKDRGNEEFKKGNYEKAVVLYTEALSIIKDHTVLWTNRAQAYIKLGEFEKAVDDCNWALRVSETCLKAYIHKGKGLAGLGKYDDALEAFTQALDIEPSKETAIKGYIKEVELKKQASEEENAAQEAFDAGDYQAKGLVGVLEKLNKPDQLPYYYSGGLRLVKEVVKDNNDRTLFRTSGGLNLIDSHPLIARCFKATPRSQSQDEVDVVAAVFEAYGNACIENEENQRVLLDNPNLPDQLLRFLESKWKATRLVKEAAIKLLHLMSEKEYTRSKLVSKYDVLRLLSCLFSLMKSSRHSTGGAAVGLLNNLALDKKFKSLLRDRVEEVLPAFESLMIEQSSTSMVLPSCVSTVTNLCGDVVLRKKLLHRKATWASCCTALEYYGTDVKHNSSGDILFSLLGLLMNLTLEPSDCLREYGRRLCQNCGRLLRLRSTKLEERVCGVVSHVLPHSEESVNQVCDDDCVQRFLDIIKDPESSSCKPALKCLTICTKVNPKARLQIVSSDNGLKAVYSLLKHSEEHILGNSALCLSHCADVPKVTEALVKTNVLMDLLVHVRDDNNANVRHNCAILIAKLAQGHPKHLERLRELDGLGILHDVLKHVKE